MDDDPTPMLLSPIAVQDPHLRRVLEAYDVFDVEEFLERVFPPAWDGIRARILERALFRYAQRD